MSQDRGISNRREPERGARTSRGAVVSQETNQPHRDRHSERQPPSFTAPRPTPAGGGSGKPVAVAVGRKPLERRNPREQRSGGGDLSAAAMTDFRREQSPGVERGRAWKRPTVRANGKWARSGREARSLSAEGKAPKGEPHERARHETRPWRWLEKQGVERARTLRAQPVGRGNPGPGGLRRSQALKGKKPQGRRRAREGRGSRLQSDSEGGTRPGELETGALHRAPAAARRRKTAKTIRFRTKVKAGSRNR